jgi:hypothetical protein
MIAQTLDSSLWAVVIRSSFNVPSIKLTKYFSTETLMSMSLLKTVIFLSQYSPLKLMLFILREEFDGPAVNALRRAIAEAKQY